MPLCSFNTASEEVADFILHHNNLTPEDIRLENNLDCIDYVDTEFVITYIPLADAEPLSFEQYTYTAIPKLYTILDTTSMEASGIIQTFNQPALGYRGKGVIIGFIDTGLDYTNPLFKNPDGSTRLLGIWDQTAATPREETLDVQTPFSYGVEYRKEQIDDALRSGNPRLIVPSTDDNGHGTFMAGIAAGNTSEELDFTGAAPECSIGVVKLKPAKQYLREFYRIQEDAIAYQENDIMLGIRYLQMLAYRHLMPLVIYIGLGTNYGSHDGTSPLGITLRGLERLEGICSVLPAGNESGLRHHYLGRIPQNEPYDDVEVRVGPNDRGFLLELWGTGPELYTIGFVSPTGEVIERIPLNLGSEINISFALDLTDITVNYRISETGSGSQFILIRFTNPTVGIWRIRVYNALFITGIFHMWLPVQGFIQDSTFFLQPNPDTTITEPANASSPITVSTYNHQNGSIYIHSSRGYARNGLVKPDLAAPGVNVFGPGLSPAADPTAYPMVRKTGSSIAAAHVAGAAADLFTWGIVEGNAPGLSDASVKAYLVRGAKRNPATYTYPNREWGYGQLDLYQTFLRTRE